MDAKERLRATIEALESGQVASPTQSADEVCAWATLASKFVKRGHSKALPRAAAKPLRRLN